MIKRKGQIVPRYLVKSVERKAQHLVKFGCDVEITGKKIKALSDGYVILIPDVSHVLIKRNRVKVKGFIFYSLTIELSGVGKNAIGQNGNTGEHYE